MWFGVQFPHLGIEIFERCHSEAAAPPAVLAEDGRVRLVNAPARAAGIVPGSTLATAHGVAPGLRHFERDGIAEQRRLYCLAESGYRFTSHVSVCPPDGLVLDIAGSLDLFGGTAAVAADLAERFARMGHAASVALAHTPAAAMTLARARALAGAMRSSAGESSDRAEILRALHDAPVACAEIEKRDVERLADMGVSRIGQLLRLPRDELGTRFGRALVDYLARLVGDIPDPTIPVAPRERFSSSLNLIEAVSSKQALLFPMRRLAAELAVWLEARQLGALGLIWKLHPLHGPSRHIETRFARARTDFRGILAIARLQLDQANLPDEIMGIDLLGDTLAPLSRDTHALIAGGDDAVEAGARMELIDRIAARLGDSVLHSVALADDHRPERAWLTRRPGSSQALTKRQVTVPDVMEDGPETGRQTARCLRPLWLFDPPARVAIEGFRLLAGPERIECGWWDDRIARDYFVAVRTDGARCWLYRALAGTRPTQSESWFLHGYFA